MNDFDYSTVRLHSNEHEIRVLDLLPQATNSKEDIVACTIRTISLDDPHHPAYLALSYTWDNPFEKPQMSKEEKENLPPLPPQTIHLNGVEMIVTGNLESFMRHTRHPMDTITVWIDALCINQQDSLEKGKQIPLMRRIYTEASKVHVWLGPSDAQTDVALDFLNEIGPKGVELGVLKYHEADLQHVMTLTGTKPEYAAVRKYIHHLKAEVGANVPIVEYKALYDRYWWYRTWVMQEICLAKDVEIFCGTKSISFDHMLSSHFLSAAYLYSFVSEIDFTELMRDPSLLQKVQYFSANAPNARPGELLGTRRRFQNRNVVKDTPFRLIQVLFRAHTLTKHKADLGATNPRDRIYGLLGLADDAAELNLTIDYGVTVEETFIDAAVQLLKHGDTDVLSLSQRRFKKLNLPSWVPDWTATIQEPCGEAVVDAYFRACGDTKAIIHPYTKLEDGRHQISLEGIRVSRIEKVGTIWNPGLFDWKFDFDEAKVLIDEVENFCAESDTIAADIYTSPTARGEAVVRTVCFDQERIGAKRQRAGPGKHGAAFNGFKLVKQTIESRLLIGAYSALPDFHNFQITMVDICWRRPFLTKEGYVGLAPADSEVGDIICVLKGAIVPFTLRQVASDTYELIGETYVHGIMDGEFLVNRSEFEIFSLV